MTYRSLLLAQLGWPPFWGVVAAEVAITVVAAFDPAAYIVIAETIAKALVAFLAIASPAIIKFYSDIKKNVSANSKRLDDKDAAEAKMREENDDLKAKLEQVQKQLAQQNAVQAGLGEAGLISNGDMKDPIRERAGQ